jgi:hypothetical protein
MRMQTFSSRKNGIPRSRATVLLAAAFVAWAAMVVFSRGTSSLQVSVLLLVASAALVTASAAVGRNLRAG